MPLIGLVLNYTPFGIRLWPTTLSLYALMLVMTWIARHRRKKLPPGEAFSIDISSRLSGWGRVDGGDKILAVGSIAALVGAGGFYLVPPRHGEEFTEFYLLGSDGKMENYPTDLVVGETGVVTVGIRNHEYGTVDHEVRLTLDNEFLKAVQEDILLKHGENWEGRVTFQVKGADEGGRLEFLLYRDDETSPYRKLHLWLSVRNRE